MAGFTSSKLLGVLREAIISTNFDKSLQDVNIFATKFPTVVRRSAVDGAVENAIIPTLGQFKTDLEQSKWFAQASILILFVLFFVSIFGITTVHFWRDVIFKTSLKREFIDIFFLGMPCIPMYFMSGAWISILHKNDMFLHSTIGPAVSNITMIITIWLGNIYFPDSHYPLAFATLTGALTNLGWQFYGINRLNDKIKALAKDVSYYLTILAISSVGLLMSAAISMHLFPCFDKYVLTKKYVLIGLIACVVLYCFAVCTRFTRMLSNDDSHDHNNSSSLSHINPTFIPLGYVPIIKLIKPQTLISFAYTVAFVLLFCLFFLGQISYFKTFTHHHIYSELQSIALALIFSKHLSYDAKSYVLYSLVISKCAHDIALLPICINGLHLRDFAIVACLLYSSCVNMLNYFRKSSLLKENKKFFAIVFNSMLTTGAFHIMHAVSCAVTSRISIGAASYVNRADKLFAAIGGLSVAPSMVLLPNISSYMNYKQYKKASELFKFSLLISILVSMPVMYLCAKHAPIICKFLYFRGMVLPSDLSHIIKIFCIYLWSIPSHILIKCSYAVYLGNHKSDFIAKSSFLQLVIDSALKILCLLRGLHLEYIPMCSVLSSWAVCLYLLFNMKKQNNVDFL